MNLLSAGEGLLAELKAASSAAGFHDFGVCEARPYPEMARLRDWLDKKYHGGMEFLARNSDLRIDPARMFPGARVSIMVVKGYRTSGAARDSRPVGAGAISRYAEGRDYHKVVRRALRPLVELLEERGHRARPHVDTAPAMEKLLAQRAGLGVIGQNSLLHHPRLGSWVFLGGVLTDAPLPVRGRGPGYPVGCSACGACIEACPTGALKGGGVLDAGRCISYWTIEHTGPIDDEVAAVLDGRVYGCDVCQEVCPMNLEAEAAAAHQAFAPYHGMSGRPISELASLGEEGFNRVFAGTSVRRIGWERFLRNVEAVARAEA